MPTAHLGWKPNLEWKQFKQKERAAWSTLSKLKKDDPGYAEAVAEHTHRIGGGTLVVATHGGAARAAIMELLDMPMEYLSAFKVLTNCAWAILDHDDIRNTWRISDYNITALPALPEQHL